MTTKTPDSTEGPNPDRGSERERRPAPRELTPEERERLREKLEEAKKKDPNIYPVF